MKKKHIFIFLLAPLIISFLILIFLWNSKLDFIQDKKTYGLKVWNTFSDHRQLINDYNENFLPNTQFVRANLHEINLNLVSWKSSNFNKQFFIEHYDSDLFIIQSSGDIFKIKNIDLYESNTKFEKELILSNLKDLLETPFIHILDTLIIDDKIYLSIKFKENEDCYKYKILESPIINNKDFLFIEFLTLDECAPSSLLGGRMIDYNHDKQNGILFTTSATKPDHPTSKPQDDNSIIGKILFINFISKEYIIFSKGHRNPQGLVAFDNIILSTEHGPKGGDEINKIIFNQNYGWPIATYGDAYNYSNPSPKYYKNHNKHGFVEPIFSYVPSIGISEIIKIPSRISEYWRNNFFISSLHGNSLYRVQFDKNYSKILFNEKIFIGSRIRDLKFSLNKNKLYLALEYKNGVLGIMDFKSQGN